MRFRERGVLERLTDFDRSRDRPHSRERVRANDGRATQVQPDTIPAAECRSVFSQRQRSFAYGTRAGERRREFPPARTAPSVSALHGGRRADPGYRSREGTRVGDLLKCVKNLSATTRKSVGISGFARRPLSASKRKVLTHSLVGVGQAFSTTALLGGQPRWRKRGRMRIAGRLSRNAEKWLSAEPLKLFNCFRRS